MALFRGVLGGVPVWLFIHDGASLNDNLRPVGH